MSVRLGLFLVPLLCFVTTGCGVILGYGEPQPVQISTQPEGCQVEVDGIKADGTTPMEVRVHPKMDHSISVTKEGYQTASRAIGKEIRTDVVILDGILTLGIGLLIDYMSGSIYKLDQSVKLNLGPVQEPTVNDKKPPTNGAKKKPCTICGEPRGDVSPCPHCGID